jgi:hypothetical protein
VGIGIQVRTFSAHPQLSSDQIQLIAIQLTSSRDVFWVEAAVSSERIVRQPEAWDHFFLTTGLLKKCTQTIHAFGGHLADREPARSMSVIALFTKVDCGLCIPTRWISSVIADFVFAFLSCVLVCESSRLH